MEQLTLWNKKRIFHEMYLTHQWPYEFNKPQWPYLVLSDRVFFVRHFTPGCQWPHHILTDRVFLIPVCETVVWSLTFRVENVFEKKKWKIPVCETVVWSLADQVKNLIEKKTRSVRHVVTGGLTKFIYCVASGNVEPLQTCFSCFSSIQTGRLLPNCL